MAQLGLHGLVGIGLARSKSFRSVPAPARRTLLFAFVLGNLLPDADMFLVGALFFVNSKVALTMHRTFTHSLFLVALVFAVSRMARREEVRTFGLGLSLGMAAHIAADVLVWFSQVTLLWPLNFWLPEIATVNLWTAVRPRLPEVVFSLLGAAEYLCFVLYSLALAHAARRFGEDKAFLPTLRRYTLAQGAAFALYLPLAFLLSPSTHNIALYALFIPIFLPIAFHTTFRMRATLGRIADPPLPDEGVKG